MHGGLAHLRQHPRDAIDGIVAVPVSGRFRPIDYHAYPLLQPSRGFRLGRPDLPQRREDLRRANRADRPITEDGEDVSLERAEPLRSVFDVSEGRANVRDWLYVDDHARALIAVMTRGRIGESYNVGGRAERSNLAVVEAICDQLDARRPLAEAARHRDLIRFVIDRPGHDRRYAIDPAKIESELGWSAEESFDSGLAKTIDWYLDNMWWWRPIRDQHYRGERLGTAA